MRVVIAIDERIEATPLERVPALLRLDGAAVVVVHVLDSSAREAWEHAQTAHFLRPGARGGGAERMRIAEHDDGERVLAAAAAVVAGWGVASVETRLLEGSPKHAVRALLDAEGADALVVFVRGHEVGPKSIHKEARFLIDHAPCPVLVVKG